MGDASLAPRPVRVWQRQAVVDGVLFFLLLPGLIGLLLGSARAGVAAQLPWSAGLAFWLLASVSVWACLYAGSLLVARLLRPWHPPLAAVLLGGAVLASLPGRYLIVAIGHLPWEFLAGAPLAQSLPPFDWSLGFFAGLLRDWAGVYAAWVATGLVFRRWRGFPRYPDAMPGPAEVPAVKLPSLGPAPAPSPSILDRLPEKLGRAVIALQAEDHYVRVHTELGSALVLARFSDAIAELRDLDGVRVHRSWWVRRGAVREVSTNGKGLLLTLATGLRVPVSHAHKEVARQAGLVPPGGLAAAAGAVPICAAGQGSHALRGR